MEGEHARSLQRAANLAHHLFIGQRIGQLARVVHRDLRRHPHHHALRASNKHSGRKHTSRSAPDTMAPAIGSIMGTPAKLPATPISATALE